MDALQIVIDTNVIVSALRSRRGASYRLLALLGDSRFRINVSVPLILEYEEAARGIIRRRGLSTRDIDEILDYMCTVARHRRIFYLWRPFLRDPKHDMVLELAIASRCKFIVTYNKRDFRGSEGFGIETLTPKEFLGKIGAL